MASGVIEMIGSLPDEDDDSPAKASRGLMRARLPSVSVNLDRYMRAIRDDTARMASCASSADPATPVPTCPGWDVRELVCHTGGVHRWATAAAIGAAPPPPIGFERPETDASGAELATWLDAGATALIDALATTKADDPTWHPFPFEQLAWVWWRRQALETAVHRWDAEIATARTGVLEPELAADGVAEYVEMLLPRVLVRQEAVVPGPSLHLRCTDTPGEWTVWSEDGTHRVTAGPRDADAALHGSAADLLLVLMGRIDRSAVDLVGDESAVGAWLDLPGL